MKKTEKMCKLAFSALFMLGGCGLVFVLLVLLNSQQDSRKDCLEKRVVKVVSKQDKEPPRVKKRVVQQRTPNVSNPKPAPKPNLFAGITGNSFGIPSLSGVGLDEIENAVLETEKPFET